MQWVGQQVSFPESGQVFRNEQQCFPCFSNPQCSRKRLHPVLLLTVRAVATSFLPDLTWPGDCPWACWPSQRCGLSQAKGFWTTELCAAGRCLGGGQHTQQPLGEEPLMGTSGAHFHYALSGLLPLQWLDCSPLYTEARLGCVDHHDGGGWLLHPLYRALTLSLEAGEWWVLDQSKETDTSLLPSS